MKPQVVRWIGGVLAPVVAVLVGAATPAEGAPTVTVRVTIERIKAIDDFEGGGYADFYACVTIGTDEVCNEDTPSADAYEDMDDISPNWEFSRQVDSAPGSTVVKIEIRDEDGGFRLGDDLADVVPGAGSNIVDLTVAFVPCTITGNVSGSCGTTIITSGDEPDRAELRFRIEVGASPSAPNLNLTCGHGPIWPQAGENVTILARALDAAQQGRSVDRIELFINDRSTPYEVETNAFDSFATVGPFDAGSTFFYGCRIFAGDEEVWSGWRVAQVGIGGGRAIPVVNTGPQASRVDIVFIPDQDTYMGPTDPAFIGDVARVIGIYLSEPTFRRRQDHFNFWIALDIGDAVEGCLSGPPLNWDLDYSFADVGVIMHTDASLRDCSSPTKRFMTGDPYQQEDNGQTGRVLVHEIGHVPFGLADEYDGDGGYHMSEPFPNVFPHLVWTPSGFITGLQACTNDVPLVGVYDFVLGDAPRTATACRVIATDNGDTFYTSEPATNDLMGDKGRVRGADLRQMEYLFGQCRLAGC